MKKNKELHKIRQEYRAKTLSKSDLKDNPIDLFRLWLNEAIDQKVDEPTAFNLATVDVNQQPSSRIVLLKELTELGFCFFTNFNSKKAKQIGQVSKAAANFFWPILQRQVRVEGDVVKCDEADSENYFLKRPYDSQLGAWASPQSERIVSREELINLYTRVKEKFTNSESIERPPFWGGYRLEPKLIEFWQGRSGRLHDRFQYQLVDDRWQIDRLAP